MGNKSVAAVINALKARRGVDAAKGSGADDSEGSSVKPIPKGTKRKAPKKAANKEISKPDKKAPKAVVKKATKKVAKKTGREAAKRVVSAATRKPASTPTNNKRHGSQADGRSFGQSGPKLDLTTTALNEKETAVLRTLNESSNPMTIKEIAETCFIGVEFSKASSYVRNALRRLVRGEAVEKVGKGVYQS